MRCATATTCVVRIYSSYSFLIEFLIVRFHVIRPIFKIFPSFVVILICRCKLVRGSTTTIESVGCSCGVVGCVVLDVVVTVVIYG